MKNFFWLPGLFIMTISLIIPGKSYALSTEEDRISYSIGQDIGKTLKRQGINLNTRFLIQGLQDHLSNKPSKMSDKEMREAMQRFSQSMRAKQEQKMIKQASKNLEEGEKFLAQNKKKPGVITTKSGLQYKVLKKGSGKSPKLTDTVVTHYRGTLLNGTEFDSSHKRGKPASFPVNGVIKGWTEALQMMKIGEKRQLFIPAGLAYGPRGAGSMIPPNATLIFEIELLEVK